MYDLRESYREMSVDELEQEAACLRRDGLETRLDALTFAEVSRSLEIENALLAQIDEVIAEKLEEEQK